MTYLTIETLIINLSPRVTDQEFPTLILAAGASSRYGRPKMLLPMGGQQGILLDRAIELGRVLSRDVRVVCGAWYPLIRFRCSSQPTAWLRSPDWHRGLSASLATGLASLGPKARGVFVLVADQPLLDVDSLRAFGEAARFVPNQPVAADYHGRPGVPAYLPRWLWPEVMALEGDRGAGPLLASVRATRVDIPGVHDDVDTPEDWQDVRSRLSQTGRTARRSRR
ncbi:nucleotidyltransferase family protein [Marinobacter arenosus]|uniref:nucleotidyltransferase family protein n=1 Tax=Marinobacter arenosus TaxID=2856822 RepID=UPI001C4B30A1|nr:nucleotidyltransferase family protein [Marinobacter arenosus]MBW0146681.1 nucleotidyltransferase family protein [Marinobacter arenosus]